MIHENKKNRLYLTAWALLFLIIYPKLTGYPQHPLLPRETVPIVYETLEDENEQIYVSIKNVIQSSSPNNLDSCINLIKNALSQSEHNTYYEGLFTSTFYLGIMYIYKGDYDMARQWFWQSLAYSGKTARAAGNTCRALNNIGNTYQFKGDYRQALAYYFKAIAIAEKRPDTDIYSVNPLIRIYISAGNTLLQLKEHEKALYYLDKAEAVTRKLNLTGNVAEIWVNKANIYVKMGLTEQAWWYNQQALKAAKHFNMHEIQCYALQNMADILREKNRPGDAVTYLSAALQLKGNINPYYQAGTLYALGCTYLLMKNNAAAEHYLLDAYRKAEKLASPEHLLRIHQQLAMLYAGTANYRQAYLHHTSAYLLNDSLLNKEKAQMVNQLEIKYRTAEKDKELMEKQLQINWQTKRLALKNIWISGTISGILLLMVMLGGLYRNNKQKQRLQEKQMQLLKSEQEIERLKAVMQGEEAERARIARELHDGLGGSLAAVRMTFRSVEKNFGFLTDTAFTDGMQMLHNISDELRETAHNLTPENILRQRLPESVSQYCEQIKKGDKLAIEVQSYGSFDFLDEHLVLSVYRIIQELVHNIVKHSNASHAIVQISRHDHLLSVAVEDNGSGFDPAGNPQGAGLKNMRTRVKSLNGRCSIESSADSGTAVYLEFEVQAANTFI